MSYFVPNGLPIARDSWATGRGGQVRSRGTTSVHQTSHRRVFRDSDHAECKGVYGLRLRSSIFCCRTCVYSKIFCDIPLVGPNAISKKSNNVVISSPRVLIFSWTLEPYDSFLLIWSRDVDRFRFGRRGRQILFFKLDFLGNR